MGSLVARSFTEADEVRAPSKTRVEIVRMDGRSAARLTFEPGWRWTECIKPVAGTELCQSQHVGAVISGRLHVQTPDGDIEVGPGEAYTIPPGHDAWVVGDEQFVGLEFESAEEYAH